MIVYGAVDAMRRGGSTAPSGMILVAANGVSVRGVPDSAVLLCKYLCKYWYKCHVALTHAHTRVVQVNALMDMRPRHLGGKNLFRFFPRKGIILHYRES